METYISNFPQLLSSLSLNNVLFPFIYLHTYKRCFLDIEPNNTLLVENTCFWSWFHQERYTIFTFIDNLQIHRGFILWNLHLAGLDVFEYVSITVIVLFCGLYWLDNKLGNTKRQEFTESLVVLFRALWKIT